MMMNSSNFSRKLFFPFVIAYEHSHRVRSMKVK